MHAQRREVAEARPVGAHQRRVVGLQHRRAASQVSSSADLARFRLSSPPRGDGAERVPGWAANGEIVKRRRPLLAGSRASGCTRIRSRVIVAGELDAIVTERRNSPSS
jgi:hypothetical protein